MIEEKPHAPGRFYINEFIFYDALGGKPTDTDKWSLEINGLVENKLKIYLC